MGSYIRESSASSVKKAMCAYFGVRPEKSRLSIHEKNAFSKMENCRHYNFVLSNGKKAYRAFGKASPNSGREYNNLRYLSEKLGGNQIVVPKAIGLVKDREYSILVVEYLEGYSRLFSAAQSLSLLPHCARGMLKIGRDVLNAIYELQGRFETTYNPLAVKDIEQTPNQPWPVSISQQLIDVKGISEEVKQKLNNRINGIAKGGVRVRRGVVHGDLGLRNVMMSRDGISFIDWDYMQYRGSSLFDPCYFVIMVLMRCIQMCLLRPKVDLIGRALFEHTRKLEEGSWPVENREGIKDGLWFEKCRAMIDTLWWYEKMEKNWATSVLKQRWRQISYLTNQIKEEARNGWKG